MSELFNNFSTLIIFLHVISAIVWIGGMIVIRFAVHYSMQNIEEPKIRLGRTLENLKRFFSMVIPSIITLLITAIILILALDFKDTELYKFVIAKEIIWFIMTPVQEILSIQYSLASAKAAIGRINKVLELKTESDGNIELKDKKIDITLKNLTFSYTEDKTTLKNISFSIKSGEKVAIIGASGSGKTTISQLIAGFYAKNSGDILYNDISIDNISKKSLREHIFLVLQMPILFNNTLRFNLTMGEDISNEKIKEALKIAQLNSMLENLPDGLDTIVGKMGIRLSGGQRQRLSIARMILANPSVVIFDESTSALDVQTETKLFENLENILKDKTVITIAHRLSTVKNASKIFVLEDGELVQSGTHLELEDKTGHYKDFVKHQLIN